jgi:hypothetical protein
MNSKDMSKWSGIFLLLSVLVIIFDLVATNKSDGGVYFCLVMSTILNVGSAIMKKLEGIEGNLK